MIYERLGPFARALIEEAKRDMGPGEPVDHHLHVAGLGTGIHRICSRIPLPGVWLNPDYRSWWHPSCRLKAILLLRAAGIDDEGDADTEYVERLIELVRESRLGGTYFLYALDWRYERPPANRTPNREKTDIFVDNDYVVDLVHCLNQRETKGARFLPVGSVHPYRPDALEALAALAARGVRHIKWLPPAQKIDPADPLLRPFYRQLRNLGIVLLSHTGNEHTLRAADRDQDLADPIRLAPASEEGVTVVMLHAGRDGIERNPGPDGQKRPYADRFFEMMRTYRSNLFGEISAVPYRGTHGLLERLLDDPEICRRLVNGSDYPTSAIEAINPTESLLRAGYLNDEGERDEALAKKRKDALDQIHWYNPLLFDFVLKRTLRVRGRQLPSSIFHTLPSGHGADFGRDAEHA
jgi:mannonate dehydratase